MKGNPFRATATRDERAGTTKLEVHLDLAIAYTMRDRDADTVAEVVSLIRDSATIALRDVAGSLKDNGGADIRKAVDAALAHPIIQGDEYTRD